MILKGLLYLLAAAAGLMVLALVVGALYFLWLVASIVLYALTA